MYGLIFDCAEKYVALKFGIEAWRSILQELEPFEICSVDSAQHFSKGFVLNRNYPDEVLIKIIKLASAKFNVSVDALVEAVGFYFLDYIRSKEGYDDMLRSQGDNLKEWIGHVNVFHMHLKDKLGDQGHFSFPVIFCSDMLVQSEKLFIHNDALHTHFDENIGYDGCTYTGPMPEGANATLGATSGDAFFLHHHSTRGSVMAPLLVGIVKKAAEMYFNINVELERLQTQGINKSEYTVWQVTQKKRDADSSSIKSGLEEKMPTAHQIYDDNQHESLASEGGCSFPTHRQSKTGEGCVPSTVDGSSSGDAKCFRCPFSGTIIDSQTARLGSGSASPVKVFSSEQRSQGSGKRDPGESLSSNGSSFVDYSVGLTGDHIKDIFPFHIAMNQEFVITQLGNRIQTVIPDITVGSQAQKWFRICDPADCRWDLYDLAILRKDALFELEILPLQNCFKLLGRMYITGNTIFSAPDRGHFNIVAGTLHEDRLHRKQSHFSLIFLVQPNINTMHEMRDHKLTWSDFGRHSNQQRIVLLEEHLKAETSDAMKSKQDALLTQAALDTKRMFVRYVSHEIRTPLNTVSMGLALIKGSLANLEMLENVIEKARRKSEPLISHLIGGRSEDPPDADPTSSISGPISGLMEIVDEVQESCNVAVGILNDLLLYEKLEGGILTLEKRCEPALSTIHEVVKTFRAHARQVGLELVCTFDGDTLPAEEVVEPSFFMDIDKTKINQVLRNILSNAIKFSSSSQKMSHEDEQSGKEGSCIGRVVVHSSIVTALVPTSGSSQGIPSRSNSMHEGGSIASVTSSKRSGGGPRMVTKKFCRVEVTDSGPGISPENQARLFNEIVQFDPNKLQGGNGSGLGLYISKGIMDLHKGRIGVFSAGEGKGACFYVDIPVHTAEEQCVVLQNILNVADERHDGLGDDDGQFKDGDHLDEEKDDTITELKAPRSGGMFNDPFMRSAVISSLQDNSASNILLLRGHDKRTVKDKFNLNISTEDGASTSGSSTSNRSVSPLAAMISPPPHSESDLKPHDRVRVVHQLPLAAKPREAASRVKLSLSSGCTDDAMGGRSVIPSPLIGSQATTPGRLFRVNDSSSTTPFLQSCTDAPKFNVLVVDDSTATRKMIVRFLKMSKMCDEIVEAADGEEALRIITESLATTKSERNMVECDESSAERSKEEQDSHTTDCVAGGGGNEGGGSANALLQAKSVAPIEFHAVLMDYVMPVMDGPTATKLIRLAGYKRPIVGVTGNVLPEDRDFFIEHGATVVTSKPLDMKLLKSLLDKIKRKQSCSAANSRGSKGASLVSSVRPVLVAGEESSNKKTSRRHSVESDHGPCRSSVGLMSPMEPFVDEMREDDHLKDAVGADCGCEGTAFPKEIPLQPNVPLPAHHVSQIKKHECVAPCPPITFSLPQSAVTGDLRNTESASKRLHLCPTFLPASSSAAEPPHSLRIGGLQVPTNLIPHYTEMGNLEGTLPDLGEIQGPPPASASLSHPKNSRQSALNVVLNHPIFGGRNSTSSSNVSPLRSRSPLRKIFGRWYSEKSAAIRPADHGMVTPTAGVGSSLTRGNATNTYDGRVRAVEHNQEISLSLSAQRGSQINASDSDYIIGRSMGAANADDVARLMLAAQGLALAPISQQNDTALPVVSASALQPPGNNIRNRTGINSNPGIAAPMSSWQPHAEASSTTAGSPTGVPWLSYFMRGSILRRVIPGHNNTTT